MTYDMDNPLLNADSYKASHWLQYPPGTDFVSSYVEARGGLWPETIFFGLQAYLKEYLETPITTRNVIEASHFWEAHGEPFHKAGWQYIVDKHAGRLPVKIEAAPEGSIIPTRNVLVQITNTDPKCFWLPSYLETAIHRAIWYPTTVATNSYQAKLHIARSLARTSDLPIAEQIGFKMHDFGARGASSFESAGIGGAAHLVNFLGTDNVAGILWADKYYQAGMCGRSIPASEHSTMTTWGNEPGEIRAMANMIDQFDGEGKIFAVVSDSYNIWTACAEKWGRDLHERVQDMKGTLVVRPDSGDPIVTPVGVINALIDAFGFDTNEKGFKVLPPQVRVLQGDGITEATIAKILDLMELEGLSADNIAFGQGGGLLQQLDRDTLGFAMKASSITVDGVKRDVYKEPVGAKSKVSKRGVLALQKAPAGITTVRRSDLAGENLLEVVWKDGFFFRKESFDLIRERANAPFV